MKICDYVVLKINFTNWDGIPFLKTLQLRTAQIWHLKPNQGLESIDANSQALISDL